MATITTTATPIAPYREACGWEKIRPTRIEPSDTTAPMPISASTPHFTQAVTSSAKACTPGGASGQTAAVIFTGAAVAGPAPSTTNPASMSTTADAARTAAGAVSRLLLIGFPSSRPGTAPPGADAEAAVPRPAPGARPSSGQRLPPASAAGHR